MSEPLTSKVPLTRLVTAVTSDITQTVTSSILWMNGRIIAERARVTYRSHCAVFATAALELVVGGAHRPPYSGQIPNFLDII